MNGSEPKYAQIYTILKRELYENKYRTGELLPTEEELIKRFDVSKTTIRHAIAMLSGDHLVNVQQGKGMIALPIEQKKINFNKFKGAVVTSMDFVGEKADGEVTISDLSIMKTRAPERVNKCLQLEAGEAVYLVQSFQMIGQDVIGFYSVYLRCADAPNLEHRAREIVRLYPFLQEKYHLDFSRSEDVLTFRAANIADAKLLSIEFGSPVMDLRRVIYSEDARPLSCSESIHRADVIRMKMETNSPQYVL